MSTVKCTYCISRSSDLFYIVIFLYKKGHYFLDILCVQEVVTSFYIVTYYIKWGNYFLDTWYRTNWDRTVFWFMHTIIALTFFLLTRYRSISLGKYFLDIWYIHTVCPGSSALFYVVPCYIKWVTTSWTHSMSKKFS